LSRPGRFGSGSVSGGHSAIGIALHVKLAIILMCSSEAESFVEPQSRVDFHDGQAPGACKPASSVLRDKPMQIALRSASTQDFDYCKRLYFAGMKKIIEELHLNMAAQSVSFREPWALTQVRIITADSSEVGWLQSTMQDDGLFVAQIFIDDPFQRKGIGTEVMHRLIGEVARLNQAVWLLDFKLTHYPRFEAHNGANGRNQTLTSFSDYRSRNRLGLHPCPLSALHHCRRPH